MGTHALGVTGVSVVAPVFGNAATLAELAARVRAALVAAGETHELLLVDDASPDGSSREIAALCADDPAVGGVRLRRNVGQYAATFVGLRHARGARVVVLDADLQDPPEAIPRLLAALDGAQAAFAGRVNDYQPRERMWTSRVFRQARSALCGLPPGAAMFLALDRTAVGRLLALADSGLSPVSLIGLARLRHVLLPVPRERRAIGRSAYSRRSRLALGLAEIRGALLFRLSAGRLPRRPLPADIVAELSGVCASQSSGRPDGLPEGWPSESG